MTMITDLNGGGLTMVSPRRPGRVEPGRSANFLSDGVLAAAPRGAGARSTAPQLEHGFTPLFDGVSTCNWDMAGNGHFVVVDGRLESVPADDVGLFWCKIPTPRDFVLRLAWLRWRHEDASGVFLRFPRPLSGGTGNAALAAMRQGFEVQIDEVGIPGATAIHKTGAIFNEPGQHVTPHPALPAATWNTFEITARDHYIGVRLNGRPVTAFTNLDPSRGQASAPDAPSFVGLQVQPGSRIAFRDISIKPL